MTAIVTRGNAMDLHLPDETVDLIVTSPPYFGLRSYQDGGVHYQGQVGDEATPTEYLDALIACTAEWMRVLKPGGSIFVNLGDKYAADNRGSGGDKKRGEAKWAPVGKAGYAGEGFVRQKSLMLLPQRYAIRCIDELGLILRAEIVWAKPNGLPESVTDRVRRSHEQVFHFVKQPRYYSAVDEIRETYSERVQDRQKYTGRQTTARDYAAGDRNDQGRAKGILGFGAGGNNPLGKLPGSVWTIPTSPLKVPESLGIDHFACVDDQTEVLTTRGWLTHDQLSVDDVAAGYDIKTGLTRWTSIQGVHRYDYDGDLVAVDARGLSMRLTPNHRTLVHRHAGRHKTRQPVWVMRADELTKQHAIPRAVEWEGDDSYPYIGEDMAALCGWVAAEGWVEGKRVRLSQSLTANPRHTTTIDDLLERLGGARRSVRERTGARAYVEVVWELRQALAARVLDLMPDKLLPSNFTGLPLNEAEALLEAFIAGDGHDRTNGRRAIFQKLRHNLDVLQAIAVRCGYNTTLAESGGRWVLYLNPPRPARLRRADGTSLVGREHYKGTVWCVTTGTGTFVARRRGTVFVTGNSYPPELVRRIVLGWSPREVCTACGEGRRPVVLRGPQPPEPNRAANRLTPGEAGNGTIGFRASKLSGQEWNAFRAANPDTIAGYACACHDTDAPATPGVVLDPFGGTGTTALVASCHGRVGISVDLSADYCRLAQWRTTDPGERARVLKVEKPPVQVDGQLGMFEGIGA